MIGVSEFCKQPFLPTESVCTIAPFWGDKICGVDVLLDAQEAILEERKCLFIQS